VQPDEREEPTKMTQRDRDLAELFAQTTAARMIDALKNPDVAEQVVDTWAEHFQKIVGKAVIRAVLYILGAAALFTAAKLNLWDKLFK
jgi:hypothetical protein